MRCYVHGKKNASKFHKLYFKMYYNNIFLSFFLNTVGSMHFLGFGTFEFDCD